MRKQSTNSPRESQKPRLRVNNSNYNQVKTQLVEDLLQHQKSSRQKISQTSIPKVESKVLKDFKKHGFAGKKIGSVYVYNKNEALQNLDLDSTLNLIH